MEVTGRTAASGHANVRPGPTRRRLRLIATSDVHAQLAPWDYLRDRPAPGLGLARAAGTIRRLRKAADLCLLLDNGDFLQGNPMADLMASGALGAGIHPVIDTMNMLGYAAATPGNHDFNYGLDFLDASCRGAAFPLVSANIVDPHGEPLLQPFVLLDRSLPDADGAARPIRIGITGFCPPQTSQWDARLLRGKAEATDICDAARHWVPRMRDGGADIVIALCHSGIEPGPGSAEQENAALHLAGIDGIDAVIAGHQHLMFPGPDFAPAPGIDPGAGRLNGRPAVMPGFWATHLGVIDLDLEPGRTAGWRVLSGSARLAAVPQRKVASGSSLRPSSPALAGLPASARAAHQATLAAIRQPVGTCRSALNSWFALVGHDAGLMLAIEAQQAWARTALAGTPWQGLPVLSAAAPSRAGGRGGPGNYTDIPAGPLLLRHLSDLCPFPNTICAVRVSGAGLRAWLDRSASLFRQIVPGVAAQALFDPAASAHNFDIVSGVSYMIDLARPAAFDHRGDPVTGAGSRIRDLRHGGRPVSDGDGFVVVTNSYRASGGGNFPGLDGSSIIVDTGDSSRDVLARHVAASGTVDPPADCGWRFAPMPGTSAVFDTAPEAASALSSVRHLAVVADGMTSGGFLRCRISL